MTPARQPFHRVTSRYVVLPLDDVDTDQIIPARFLKSTARSGFGEHVFHGGRYDADGKPRPGFVLNRPEAAGAGILVAGRNFGCGSSREQAVSTLKGHELVVVARSFARIFFQNAMNLGLQVVVAPDIAASERDELEIGRREVGNRSTGGRFRVVPLPAARQALIDAGGLIPYTRSRLQETAGKR